MLKNKYLLDKTTAISSLNCKFIGVPMDILLTGISFIPSYFLGFSVLYLISLINNSFTL